ncbi:hypothetical protein CALCODRAFT_499070 [Calocera cornea HHB12733]|uniref:N-acetyltransferase domain-containing protein n=1 Tax=Calocera cornea HHB12733 TaxID=1353952 RepID=A0A165ELR2_9BASI|nr:hypothetical protein CALCODRAFT_499070 [Calocera cornea HHB12733]
MSHQVSRIHIRRLVDPSKRELACVLKVLRVTFAQHPIVPLILAGNITPEGLDALDWGFLRAGLEEGEGEVWIAEHERPDMKGAREIVGVTIWHIPGNTALNQDRVTTELRWKELVHAVGTDQGNWFLNYFIPRTRMMWNRYLPTPGDMYIDAYHCQLVCVLPEFHNQGVVSALGTPAIRRAVREGKRVLGEGSSATDARKYEHMGCRIFGNETFQGLPGSNTDSVQIWPLEVLPKAFTHNSYWNRDGKL